MAAAQYDKLLWVLCPEQAQHESSPAVLRLWAGPAGQGAHGGDVSYAPDALEVRVLKRRGPPLGHALHLSACVAPLARLLAASQQRQGHALDCTAACA